MEPVYLDCNATTPLDPAVREILLRFLDAEYGNAGSRTHEFGVRAKQAVQRAREQVAALARCEKDEVIFTSGATESNNLSLLGLKQEGLRRGHRHIIATAIEHKAVLEPLEHLATQGFEVTLLPVDRHGVVSVDALRSALRPDTLLVSVMHVNNETGVVQPLAKVIAALQDHPAFLHVDAAQGFGKCVPDLQHPRIDLMSISGHKLYAPKGVGALIARRRGYERMPLAPLAFGGGQERGLRPGTQPVALIAALGEAAEQASKRYAVRNRHCARIKAAALKALRSVGGSPNGEPDQTVPSTLNISFPGLDSEAMMVALKPWVAISNGSACTSQNYTASHVLVAMGLSPETINGALRLSWCHLTPEVPWGEVAAAIRALR